MTDFQKMYQDKLTTPERIAQQVQSGWLIGMDTATSQTPAIMAAMAQHIRSTDITGVKVQTLLDGYPFDFYTCLLYTSPSPRESTSYRMPSSA